MTAEYERITARSKEDPGTAGDEGEENWAQLLRRWLPKTYNVVTKGRVLFANGAASRQIDVAVLSPSYPRGLLDEKLKMYLAPGVLAAFECKNTLRLEHVRHAIETGVELRQLARDWRSPAQHEIVYGVLAHSHAVDARLPEESIAAALERGDEELVKDPRDCLDIICVAELGTWTLMQFVQRPATSPQALQLESSYMGPGRFQASIGEDVSRPSMHDPVGRMLTALLRRLAPVDPALGAIAKYFHDVGLFGVGQGSTRTWYAEDLADLPDAARRTIW